MDDEVEIVYPRSSQAKNDYSQQNLIRLFELKNQIGAARAQQQHTPMQSASALNQDGALALFAAQKQNDPQGKLDLRSLIQLKKQMQQQQQLTSRQNGSAQGNSIDDLKEALKANIKDALQRGTQQPPHLRSQGSNMYQNNGYSRNQY